MFREDISQHSITDRQTDTVSRLTLFVYSLAVLWGSQIRSQKSVWKQHIRAKALSKKLQLETCLMGRTSSQVLECLPKDLFLSFLQDTHIPKPDLLVCLFTEACKPQLVLVRKQMIKNTNFLVGERLSYGLEDRGTEIRQPAMEIHSSPQPALNTKKINRCLFLEVKRRWV